MTLAGDRDRERAAASLREHFMQGRITLDELAARTELALTARTRQELRRALDGLPGLTLSVARALGRGAVIVLCTGAWLVFSFLLLVVFAITLLVHGASVAELIGFLVVWLVPTFLVSRLWRRGLSHRPRNA
ncbi:MAG TPA: DUF1707 domain-containing protein [Gaiellaceae bacterium]|jgi:hypothetical protein|nr:DUF1707 domain-containing protein [Gaiellaceae bacterium]